MPRYTRWTRTTVKLPRSGLLGIDDGRGMRLEVAAGRVWLTQHDDRRDVILGPGDRFVIDRPGRTLVQAFDPAELNLEGVSESMATNVRQPFPPLSQLRGLS